MAQFKVNLKNPNDIDLLWWEKQLKKLKKKNSDDVARNNMAYRIKFNVYVGIFSTIKFNSKNLTIL